MWPGKCDHLTILPSVQLPIHLVARDYSAANCLSTMSATSKSANWPPRKTPQLKVGSAQSENGLPCVHQFSARLWNRAAHLARRFNPFTNDGFDIGQRFLIRCSICGASGQFRNLGNECQIILAPVDYDLVTDAWNHE